MLTNFIDAAAVGLCRGLNGVFGSYPSACLVSAGRPALYLATVALLVVCGGVVIGWRRFHS